MYQIENQHSRPRLKDLCSFSSLNHSLNQRLMVLQLSKSMETVCCRTQCVKLVITSFRVSKTVFTDKVHSVFVMNLTNQT